jgi:hypothetical protein
MCSSNTRSSGGDGVSTEKRPCHKLPIFNGWWDFGSGLRPSCFLGGRLTQPVGLGCDVAAPLALRVCGGSVIGSADEGFVAGP